MVEVTCRAACHRRSEPRCAKAPDRREILTRTQPLLVGHAVDLATGQPPPRTMAVQPTPQPAQTGLRTQRQSPPARPRSWTPDPCPSNHRACWTALVSMANTRIPWPNQDHQQHDSTPWYGGTRRLVVLPARQQPAEWPRTLQGARGRLFRLGRVPGGRFWRPCSHPLWMMPGGPTGRTMAAVACRACPHLPG